MNEPRVIRATFSDWRPVKSRKVLQLILEVPLERTNSVLEMLGAPLPDSETWVAVALLDKNVALAEKAEPTEGERIRTRAVLLCREPQFQKWILSNDDKCVWGDPEQSAKVRLCEWCNIASRAELATNKEAQHKFLEMETQYMQDTGRMARPR